MSDIRAVLFDMGGVLVQLDSLETVLGSSSLTPDLIWERWILSKAVQEFERGRCDVETLATAIVAELELEGTAAEFIDRFIAFPQGLFPGAAEMVADVPAEIVTGVLSNTSALHWENQRDADQIRALCQRSYLSYELGVAKPSREIYDCAVNDLGIDAGHVLFIDDNQINVDGAVAAGLRAGLAKGPDQARQVLTDFEVLPECSQPANW